jgi:hemolysin III
VSVVDPKIETSDSGSYFGEPPLQHDQEWANALTHAVGACGAIVLGIYLVSVAYPLGIGLAIASFVYAVSAAGTFLFSTLSHVVRRQPLLNHMRAWDQAMIYTMISGTYTPIIYQFATDAVRVPLLIAIWIAAALGFFTKTAVKHRVNSSGTISYLLLGWLPAIPLVQHVPSQLAGWMVAGGVSYTIGVLFLVNDRKIRYLHAAWHVSVMTAATCHFYGILQQVILFEP